MVISNGYKYGEGVSCKIYLLTVGMRIQRDYYIAFYSLAINEYAVC